MNFSAKCKPYGIIAFSEHVWSCPTGAAKFKTYQDQQRLMMTILMALHGRFEPIRASLLHLHPLPILDDAVTELLSEETLLGAEPHNSNAVITTYCSKPGRASNKCTC